MDNFRDDFRDFDDDRFRDYDDQFNDAEENNLPKKPVGDSIRELLNSALQDERKQKIQLDILNGIFARSAIQLPGLLKKNLSSIFNALEYARPGEKNQAIIETLTVANGWSQKLALMIPISTTFTEFTAEEIRKLPGYIKLHEAARAENVALQFCGLPADEMKSGAPPLLIIDGSKTYDQGAMENSTLYPQLEPLDTPAPKRVAERQPPKTFTFKPAAPHRKRG